MAVPKPLVRTGRVLSNSIYRASGGRLMGKVRGMPVLLITVPGRKTCDLHTTPVSYFEDDGKFLVTGSGAGSATEPQWFKNLRHTDQAEIEFGRRKTPVNVAIASDEERGILWQRLLLRAPFFADYQKKIERQIPMAILTPTPDSGS
jgi:deazaflavin-dependent oxidoreductase (nitroreductase family)